ncbi:hypothetical protein SLEP1_g25215 [Rubroshorea leprosula]|uniref:Uncharacterized protein n=1 Tax=Rubroshorea leprosula TaxID=152421 RepID=A0AAV5JVK1_9ROSI|nr:hypothetical protein SLEP1_g25215 [Rubroshorea leprosula]
MNRTVFIIGYRSDRFNRPVRFGFKNLDWKFINAEVLELSIWRAPHHLSENEVFNIAALWYLWLRHIEFQ